LTFIIIIFGIITLLSGIIIILKPEIIFGKLNKNIEKFTLYVLVIVVRLVPGEIHISISGDTRYPFVIEVIG
jgi:hypothetical protein